MISTDCEKCIHDEVCGGLKQCIKEAENKVNESGAGYIHPSIDIKIKCLKYYVDDSKIKAECREKRK